MIQEEKIILNTKNTIVLKMPLVKSVRIASVSVPVLLGYCIIYRCFRASTYICCNICCFVDAENLMTHFPELPTLCFFTHE